MLAGKFDLENDIRCETDILSRALRGLVMASSRGNLLAVVYDRSTILGEGDNGPYASLAAMFSNRVRHFDYVINRGC